MNARHSSTLRFKSTQAYTLPDPGSAVGPSVRYRDWRTGWSGLPFSAENCLQNADVLSHTLMG